MLNCIKSNGFSYLSLLRKYFDKCSVAIGKGINEGQPLKVLFNSGNANERWLNLYFDIAKRCNVKVTESVLDEVITLSENNDALNKIVKQYLESNGTK